MKKILIFAILISISFFSQSQSYIQIGNGEVSTSYPPYSVWKYGWFSAIYPQSDIGAAKTITKIAVHCINGPKIFQNQKIYLSHTSLATFGSANYEEPVGQGFTLVFQGNITMDGWTEILFDTPFQYNGTGNLLLHWENRSGNANYANFNSSVSVINNNKSQGSDVSFPIGTGYLNPYPGSLPNIRLYYASSGPTTPGLVYPSDLSAKINVDSLLRFSIGSNTTKYDVYLSTDSLAVENLLPSSKVAADVPVVSSGVYSYTPPAMLSSLSRYYWRVVAGNASASEPSPLWRFTTQKVINAFPFIEGFEDSTVFYPGWYGQKTEWTYINSGVNAIWHYVGTPNPRTGDYCAYASPNQTSSQSSLVTPRIHLPQGYKVSFWWRNGDPAKVHSADTTFFEASADGGISWNTLGYLSSELSQNQYEQAMFDLNEYAGTNTYLRWRYVLSNYTNHKKVFLDDISISPSLTIPEIEIQQTVLNFGDIVQGAHTHKKVVITNIGSVPLSIQNAIVQPPYYCDYSHTILPSESDTVDIVFSPTSVGLFDETITFQIDGSFSGQNFMEIHGNGIEAQGSFFESFDQTLNLPQNWNKIRSNTDLNNDVTVVASTLDAYSLPNVCKVLNMNDSISSLMLITPGVQGFETNKLRFYAKKAGNYNLDIIIGTMDDPYDATTFSSDTTISLTEVHQLYTIQFPDSGNKPYIAFKHGQNKKVTSFRIDDISWENDNPVPPNPAVCVYPPNNSVNIDIMMGLNLKWTSGGGSPTGYKVYFGTTNPPSELMKDTTGSNCDVSFPLSFDTEYFWKIVPYNNFGENSEDCPVWKFRTMTDPTIIFLPWSENFELIQQTDGFTYPLGWSYENLPSQTGQTFMGECWDLIVNNSTNPNNAHSAPNAMASGPEFYQKNNWLFTPPIAFNNTSCKLSFWYKMVNSGVSPDIERMKVTLGTSHSAATVESILWDNDSIVNTAYEKAEIIFTPQEGISYIGFQAYSPSNYPIQMNFVLIIDDIQLEYLTEINELDKGFSIYPNPSDGQFIICQQGNYIPGSKIYVMSPEGKIVYNQQLMKPLETISLKSLQSGVYFVYLKTEQQQVIKKLLIR